MLFITFINQRTLRAPSDGGRGCLANLMRLIMLSALVKNYFDEPKSQDPQNQIQIGVGDQLFWSYKVGMKFVRIKDVRWRCNIEKWNYFTNFWSNQNKFLFLIEPILMFLHVELLLNLRYRIVRLLQKKIWPHCGVSTTMGKVLIAEYYFFSVEKSCTRNWQMTSI